ncbi:MAG: class I SAM-dependent methyltransferase [Pseudomonadales bacterium]|jgi:ubiquinone/menaquinone biosynthesis C-methylase UbiE|nr:class I SAM-dependent methyltransferase [Pseudomonadales bacterium]
MGQATFWNLIAKRYSKANIADQESYEKKLAITREYLEPESEVLEFGCGTGSTALLHAPHVKHILATDVATKMISIAEEKRVQGGVDNVSFEVNDLDGLVARGGQYDVVLGLNILHLLDDLDTALSQVATLTKEGGVFINSTACLQGKYKAVRAVGAFFRLLGLFPTINAFTENELLEAHRRAGFAIEAQWAPEGGDVVFVVARKQEKTD